MSDERELLELAAKAAGISGQWAGDLYCYGYDGTKVPPTPWKGFRPLTDDGDALRLAVTLHLAIDIGVMMTSIDGIQDRYKDIAMELHGEDPCAATRRAIVRAAAEIGKSMP